MKLKFLLFAGCMFSVLLLSAQTTITGKITDENNSDPLIGASVVEKGNEGNGTVSDFDGAFALKVENLPVTLIFSYIGYSEKEVVVSSGDELEITLSDDAVTIETDVVVRGQRVSDKQKAAPLTVESMGLTAIKETPSDNFYDGLGSLKGVDLTAASLGFKVVNTRGFNSTSPVRSLQLIDGVDNQAPGLNFSLGNFLGTSELDVLKVDLIVGASSAFYGPNAFNGVIDITTKDPFFQKGLSASVKGGERNLLETAIRWADAIKNKDGHDFFGYKFNLSYLRADDWEADNFDPVFDTDTGRDNPGGYDAVNIYGDEYQGQFDNSDSRNTGNPTLAGIGQYHRRGYKESDLVDYDTRNFKSQASLHFRLKPEEAEQSPEVILAGNFSQGTTVYQGDNRFSLRNIQFFQGRLELRKREKYFIRAYTTHDNAGDSYDPYFTALRLQEIAKTNNAYGIDFRKLWANDYRDRMEELGYPSIEISGGNITFDQQAADEWLVEFQDSLTAWHNEAARIIGANQVPGGNPGGQPFFEPGTDRFNQQFDEIVSSLNNIGENGTRFFDESALYHIQGEYTFNPEWASFWKVGASGRLYTPDSQGTIFYDTISTIINGADTTFQQRKITNNEFGIYTGLEKKFFDDNLTASATLRMDKNENFDYLFSPAASLVWKPRPNNYFRISFSSAIRNPTLSDQFLFLNVGRATLAGNLEGVDGLITLESFDDYRNSENLDTTLVRRFDIAPIRPERVNTIEAGYRTTLWNSLYVDASYYYSIYNDFLGFNIGIDADFDDDRIPDIDIFRYAANSINQVTTQGFSIGLNYYFATYFSLNGNYSWNRLNEENEDDPIIPAFNTPEHKFNISLSGRNLSTGFVRNWGFNVNYKWVEGFLFEGSPQFTGLIPSYGLLDAQVNWKMEDINTTLKIGASNVLNNLVFQAYGGPRIGRLAYVSLVYEWKKR